MLEYTLCRPQDKPELAENWELAFHDNTQFTDFVFDRFAGLDHTWAAKEDGQLVASACAVPVTMGQYRGIYLYGVNTRPDKRGKGVMDGLMRHLHGAEKNRGAQFAVLVPAGGSLFHYYEKFGYQTVFYRHRLTRPIRSNVWAQAEFDTITASRLRELRRRFIETDLVEFAGPAHAAMVQDLYAGGATTVENEGGYGVFFQLDEETLEFRELMASDNLAAGHLLEAARQRTGCRTANIFLPRYSDVYLGEGGTEEPYGQLCWLTGEKKLTDPYMGLMCD